MYQTREKEQVLGEWRIFTQDLVKTQWVDLAARFEWSAPLRVFFPD